MKRIFGILLILTMSVSMLVGCGGSGDANSEGNADVGNGTNNEQESLSDEEKVNLYLEEFMDSVVLDGMNWLEAKGDAKMGYYFNEAGKYSSSNTITKKDQYTYYGNIVKDEELFEDASGEREYYVSGVTRNLNRNKLYVSFQYGLSGYDMVMEKGAYKVDSLDRLEKPEYVVDSIHAHIDWAYWKDEPYYDEVAPVQAEWLEGAMSYLIEHECEMVEDIMKAWELDAIESDAYNTAIANEASKSEFTYNTKYGNVRFVVDNQTGVNEEYADYCSLTIIFEDETAACGYISFTEYAKENDDGETINYLDYTLTREQYTEE